MTSETGGPQGITDDRLVEARDSVLADGETILAQEEGDQGQGIVLTSSRVLILKVGITATRVPNGRVIGDFPLHEITAVHLRRGPLGAVIQVCTAQARTQADSSTPDNVIIFTGSARVKKCEAMAASIEEVIGKPVGRVEPTPQQQESAPIANAAAETPAEAVPAEEKPRGGREARSLAEEMFAEITEESVSASSAPQPVVIQSDDTHEDQEVAEEPIEETTASAEFGPNPNLPKPVRARNSGAKKMLVLLGLLMAALMVGVAVTAPLRRPEKSPRVDISVAQVTNSPAYAQKQLKIVADFESALTHTLSELSSSLPALESALRSSNRAAIASALRSSAADRVWQKVSAIQAPPGLTGPRETIVTGLFTIKGAVADISADLQSNAPLDVQPSLSRIAEGKALVGNGLGTIKKMREDLARQTSIHKTPAP